MKKTLILRIAALAALALAAATAPASATVYDWSADIFPSSGGSILGSGTITAQNTISTSYDNNYTGNLVTAITGTFDGIAITGLSAVNSFYSNDNLVNTSGNILDYDGISFQLAGNQPGYGPNEVNLYYLNSFYAESNVNSEGTFTLTPAASVAVPEPSSLPLLASGALGLLLVARRRRAGGAR